MFSTTSPSFYSNDTFINPGSLKPIKQGWVLKKTRSPFLPHWRPKYLVLFPASQNPNYSPALIQLFNHCDQSTPPKYQLILKDLPVMHDLKKPGFFTSKTLSVFTLPSSKPLILATNTRSERNEWMKAFQCVMDPTFLYKPNIYYESNHTRNNSFSNADIDNKKIESFGKAHAPFIRHKMKQDDDAVSTYSAVSFNDSVRTIDETRSISSSHLETLSFCSEPVLTPDELLSMGSDQKLENQLDTNIRKKAIFKDKEYICWNEKYQSIINAKIVSEEDALQQDAHLLEIIGSFKEFATIGAQKIIDSYHIPGSFDGKMKKCPFGGSDLMCIQEYGVVYRFASNFNENSIQKVHSDNIKASQELLATNVLMRALSIVDSNTKPSTILLANIDYKGFRIVAYADPGINNHDLIVDYLADYPKTHDGINDSLIKATQALNLKPHTVQLNRGRRIAISTSIDIEVYQSKNQSYISTLYGLLPLDTVYDGETLSEDWAGSLNGNDKSINSKNIALDVTPQDDNLIINQNHRLRAEFIIGYTLALSSDSNTIYSAATKKEKETNDIDAIKASIYLRDNWIPAFVNNLDEMEIRPIDSHSLSIYMHRHGINIRYLGIIAKLSKLPYIRNMACIEMIARSVKHYLNSKTRSAILHFKSVGATQIETEMRSYVISTFSTILGRDEKNERFFIEKIQPVIFSKFNHEMDYPTFSNLHKPAIFLALQYHCGVLFEDSTDYDFDNSISKSKFIKFCSKVKTISGLPRAITAQETNAKSKFKDVDIDDQLAYQLTRYFKSVGPKSKLAKLDTSAYALSKISAHYCSTGRYDEANLYATAAKSTANRNSCYTGISLALSFQSESVLHLNALSAPDSNTLSMYHSAINSANWCWGEMHPLSIAIHDRLVSVYLKSKKFENALEIHEKSLEIAISSLGKNHSVTAGYLTKTGSLLFILRRTDEAIENLTEALHIYEGLKSDPSYIAEVHYYYAECLEEKGDISAALNHSQTCRKIREKIFGLLDSRSVDSFRQVGRLLLSPYQNYNGVITPQIRKAYNETIMCLEKVFRYLKSVKDTRKNRHHAAEALISFGGAEIMQLPFDTDLISNVKIAGPLLKSPFGPSSTIPRNLLHQLTKKIIGLKLALVESPKHRENIRYFRTLAENAEILDPAEAKSVILKLAAVSPSIYLDGIFQRIEDEEDSALEELKIILMLTEQETVGMMR